MNNGNRFSVRGPIAEGAIIVFGSLVSLWLVGYFKLDWTKPARLDADPLLLLTFAKGLINGHGFRFDAQLGYPDVKDGLYFPNFDLSYRVFMWLAARVTSNPFLIANLLYVAGLSAMYGLAYWVLRRLTVRRLLAGCGALAYVLTPFLASRIYGHDALTLSVSVPLGFGLALMIALSRQEQDLKGFLRDPLTIATVLVVGSSGLYYAFYTLMFMAFAGVAASAAQRRWFPLQAAASAGALLFVMLVYAGYGFDLLTALGPKFVAPHRAAYEQLLYGLDLSSAATPFQRIPKVAQGIAQAHAALPESTIAREGEGEWPALPLTLALACAPLIAAVSHGARGFGEDAGKWLRVLGACSILAVFAILFGARGGLGYLFNLLVTAEIRADSRLMPFLVFAAVVILCAAAELAATFPWRWLRWAGPALAAVALVVSVAPAINAAPKKMHFYMDGPLEQRLRDSTPLMLVAKNRANLRAVLELPMASWPEAPVRPDSGPL